MTLETKATELSQRNQKILEDAWKRFSVYDRTAVAAQKRFVLLRKWILTLGVASTTLAVLNSTLTTCVTYSTLAICKIPWVKPVNDYLLHNLVILTPITVSVLLAGAIKFDRGINWVLLRNSAEAIKREIYRYRTRVGMYQESREAKLANEVKIIGERLMKTQANRASLEPYEDDKPTGQLSEVNKPPHPSEVSTTKDGIADHDDQFSDLDAQKYLNWRLMDQLRWYRGKIRKLDRQLQWLQWLIFILGGVGTFLAAIKYEVWIAVSNAVAAAFASFLEFRQIETTLTAYNQAASNLENILYWWHTLSEVDRNKHDTLEKLVKNTESVIQKETAGWVQEMRDALVELYSDTKTSEKRTKGEHAES